MASDWPVFVSVMPDEARDIGFRFWTDTHERVFVVGDCAWEPYIHRDAARAWQALRDFLNGTPDQWQKRCVDEYDQGYEDGFADLDARIRG